MPPPLPIAHKRVGCEVVGWSVGRWSSVDGRSVGHWSLVVAWSLVVGRSVGHWSSVVRRRMQEGLTILFGGRGIKVGGRDGSFY